MTESPLKFLNKNHILSKFNFFILKKAIKTMTMYIMVIPLNPQNLALLNKKTYEKKTPLKWEKKKGSFNVNQF